MYIYIYEYTYVHMINIYIYIHILKSTSILVLTSKEAFMEIQLISYTQVTPRKHIVSKSLPLWLFKVTMRR